MYSTEVFKRTIKQIIFIIFTLVIYARIDSSKIMYKKCKMINSLKRWYFKIQNLHYFFVTIKLMSN